MAKQKKQYEQLRAGVVQVLPEGGLEKKLALGRPLRIKLGADPTAPDLHLGHAVVLSKLRQFQENGHTIQFVIGDFTAAIGDPTGKSVTRPPLAPEEIAKNAQTYLSQVSRILDPEKLEVAFNGSWLSALSIADFVRLAGKVTVARIIEREDFAKRLAAGTPIGFHELFYPLFQGYDSVHLHSDVELGGTDQTFNLLAGRFLQEQYSQEPQIIMTLPLLEGLDGVQKMSKSLGNYVGLSEPAHEAYGKLLSISDTLMWRYWLLLGGKTESEIAAMQEAVEAQTLHPMECKKEMARTIVARFWSVDEAHQAQQQFEAVFQRKEYDQAVVLTLSSELESPLWIVDLLRHMRAVGSSSDARRLIAAGAVSVDQQKITDVNASIDWRSGIVVRVGKHRIYRVTVEK